MNDEKLLERLRAELIETHQMAAIGRLLTGIVHEIRTPIASILSNNEVVRRSLPMLREALDSGDVDKVRRVASTIESLAAVDQIACERISGVIRGLKSFSRTDCDERRKANVNEGLRDTLKLAQAEFRRRIQVESDFGDVPEVLGYPQMLNQVFLNLLVNAGQAIEGEGRITVRTRLEDGVVHISIADSGRGMTVEQKAHAFDEGYTTKAVGEGTGLGLSISREIIEKRHGGSITFESVPGVGTTFHIRIPVEGGVHRGK